MPSPTVAVYVSRLLSADVISGAFQGVRLIPKFGVGEFDGSGGGGPDPGQLRRWVSVSRMPYSLRFLGVQSVI